MAAERGPAGGRITIRGLDPARDGAFLRQCVLELQATERGFDPRLPAGEEMVEAYVTQLLARQSGWHGVFALAELEGAPAGLATLFLEVPGLDPDEPADPYALLSDLCVLPQARGQGVGSALLDWVEALTRRAKVSVLRLEVMAGNVAARRFYARRGWRERIIQLER